MKFLSILCLFALTLSPLRAELFMVDRDDATVYLDGRSTGTLAPGEIVDGNWAPGDEWVIVARDGRDYKIRRRRLIAEEELALGGRKQLLELEAKTKQLRQDYQLLLAERAQLAQLAIQTERDLGIVVVFPGVRIRQVPTTSINDSRYGRTIQMIPRITVQPEETATLTSAQARRVEKIIEDRREIIDPQIAALARQRLEADGRRVSLELELARRQARFARYKLFPDDYLRERFVVTSDRAAVYRDVNAVGELRRQEITSGILSPRDPEWVTLPEYDGGPAKVRTKHLAPRSRVMAEIAANVNRIQLQIELAEQDLEQLLARKQAIRAATNDLAVLIERGDRFVDLDPDDLARRRDERVLPVPVGAVETANAHRAKKQIRDFEDRLDELNPQLNDSRSRILELRRQLLELETRQERLDAAFELDP